MKICKAPKYEEMKQEHEKELVLNFGNEKWCHRNNKVSRWGEL